MQFLIITDLEGPAGIDSFSVTRSSGDHPKTPARDQLGREVIACTAGIHDAAPDAEVDVWDGDGSGGLRKSDVEDAQYLQEGSPYRDAEGYDGFLFVGQHAMAGTLLAPLAHTYSSKNVLYYRLDGYFVGEFGARALIAGRQGVPTIYLAGDDKAAREAEATVPGIETTAVKRGFGLERAEHMDHDDACEAIRADASRAVARLQRGLGFALPGSPVDR